MQPVWLSLQIGNAVPTGAEQVCGVVGVMQVGVGPPSELPAAPLALPLTAPALAPEFSPDVPEDVPVELPAEAPLFVPAELPDAPVEDTPVEAPLVAPLVDPDELPVVVPDTAEVPLPDSAGPPGLEEQATTIDIEAATRKPYDSQFLRVLISKLSQARLRDGAR